MRNSFAFVVLIASLPVFVGFDCSDDAASPEADVTWTTDRAVVTVRRSPFGLTIANRAGAVLLESSPLGSSGDDADPTRAYAPLALTHNENTSGLTVMYGWNYFRGEDDPWKRATDAARIDTTDDALTIHLKSTHAAGPVTLTIAREGGGLRLVARPDADDGALNRMSLGFALHDDDHFFGFGERFVHVDHRGQNVYTWVEDGGFGHGEQTPPGPANPSPSGTHQTNVPIPWFMNPRGFGVLMNTTYRTNFHLGDESSAAWRVEATTGVIDATVLIDDDPLALVASLTAITGRPPEIADWVLAPRRRANPGTDEVTKLRAAHIPTSVIDESVHYFPNGAPKGLAGAPMKALTADLHKRGFKAIAYFCPFVADSFHPVFDEAVAKGFLVKKPDGAPYLVLDTPYNAGMVDFTNPDAVAWYQRHLQGALDDGWDGWMYDFAEYIPQDAVFANGMHGMEAHNLYPVLYQKAAYDLLERQRRKDYLIFVRSGFTGTGGLVPMVWAGDQNTDFDRADGLPAALVGALNAGMSGLPLWGSDISGYHFVFNPPPDKEVYLRWTEVGAFSADMHDENEGSGNDATSADRWQIWKDQESQDVYRKYASYKTRMLPYVRVAVRQARDRGTPVMRHLYLTHPKDPRVYAIGDEYMYGDSLLVAPVVARGATSRSVYLPDAAYFDFWTGARVVGGGEVTASAPLDVVPVFATVGAIVPMLAADVETVVPSEDKSVVSAADRADFLEVIVFAGGDTKVSLDDGTLLAQKAPAQKFEPGAPSLRTGPVPIAAAAADLATCPAACAWNDPTARVLRIAVVTAEDIITAGDLEVRVAGSPSVKRYLFSVHY
jgi:alpha-glucosidase (family GH31 glycosyl hydrolase)